MRLRSILVLSLIATFQVAGAAPATTADPYEIPNNPVDLRADRFFSRPVTELEIVMINLKAQAERVAAYVGGNKAFKLLPQRDAEGSAGFDPRSGRIILSLTLTVADMSDPWREVCDSALKSFDGWFAFPTKGLDIDTSLNVLGKYFGYAAVFDPENAKKAIKPFLDSIAIRVVFMVGSADQRTLRWLRTCTRPGSDLETIYTEYEYAPRQARPPTAAPR